MKNSQSFSDIGNSQVTVNTAENKNSQVDPMQLMAFDTSKKINRLVLVIVILVLTNLALLSVCSYEAVSTRQQYDKLRHTVNDFKDQVKIMEGLLDRSD